MAFPYYQPQYQTYYPYQPVQNYAPAGTQQNYAQQNYTPSGIIWVSGEQEAQMYPIAPNNAVALWARDGKTIFLKSADATGKPSMKTYDLVERAESASDGSHTEDGKTAAYATKDDLSAVVGVVRGFDEVLSGVKSEIESMKGDLYGIAGKKKSAKKREEVEDDE